MKNLLALSLTTASLLAASSAWAGGNCSGGCDRDRGTTPEEVTYPVLAPAQADEAKCPGKEGSEGEGVAVLAQDEEMEGERPQRPERGERGERPQRGEGEEGERPRRGDRDQMGNLGLDEDQQAAVKAIMDASREEGQAIIAAAREASEAGEEVDRAAIREQLGALREAAQQKVYDEVLTEEQQVKVDEMKAEREARRAEREANGGEGEEGDRPQRRQRGGEEGDRRQRGGDENLDL